MSIELDEDQELARAQLWALQQGTLERYDERPPFRGEPPMPPELVEHMRKVFLAHRPDASEADFEEHLRGHREQLGRFEASTLTPFEEPTWYGLVTHMYALLEKSLPEMGLSLSRPPLLGTLAMGRVNGLAVACPGVRTRIVLFERGLFNFAHLMCKAVAAAFPFQGESDEGRLAFSTEAADIDRLLLADPAPMRRFFEALSAYVVRGDASHSSPYAPPGRSFHVAEMLLESMEFFVLGHELGHIAAGHLEGRLARCALADGVEAEAQEMPVDWRLEHEADMLGMHLMIRTMARERQRDVALSYWGADLFLACTQVVECAVHVLATGELGFRLSATHPPPRQRQMFLRRMLAESVQPAAQAQGAVRLAEVVDGIVDRFWAYCEPRLRRMHRHGLRPARWWTPADAQG